MLLHESVRDVLLGAAMIAQFRDEADLYAALPGCIRDQFTDPEFRDLIGRVAINVR